MAVATQLVVEAVTPLNVTEPELPKLEPEIVTDWPIPPGFGEIEEIVGACASAKPQARIARVALRPNLRMDRSTPGTS